METVQTLLVPQLPTGGRTLHVVPGSGGGDGSDSNPFQGIAAADAVAQPGDIFLVRAGDYGGAQVQFDTAGTAGNYVVWKAADGATPTINDLRIRGDYIWIEGFDISAPDNAVRNEGNSFGAVVKGNRITGCHYCIHLNSGAESWWIAENVIVGDQVPSSGSFSGEGIELQHTAGHTIAYNSISRTADAISYPDHNVDIFGNDIFENSDDGIEADSGYANIRIWGNRIHHAHNNGLTFQPMNGAPWYVMFNQVIGSGESVLKVRTAVDRVVLAHNTFVGWSRVFQNSVGFIRNMHVRNNIWISMTGDYLWEDTDNPAVPENYRTSIDFDGFAWPTSTTVPIFKWHDVRYDTLAELQAAAPTIEQNAIRTPMSCFDTLNVPGPAPAVIPPHHVTLADGCNAIDAGEVLPNINDHAVGVPDLGAHERGGPQWHYGPDPPPPGTGGAGGAGGSSSTSGSGGSSQSGGGTSSGVGANAAATGADDDGGCGCRTAGGDDDEGYGSLAWLALLGAFALRRRRAR
jgi:MYXO-CTERM domain-containing protein